VKKRWEVQQVIYFLGERAKSRQQANMSVLEYRDVSSYFFVFNDREVHMLGVLDQGEAGRCRWRDTIWREPGSPAQDDAR
jgi:hypothetical protein